MRFLRIVLLVTMLILFLGLESIGQKLFGVKNVWIFGVSLFGPGVQDLLGLGVLVCEVIIILTFTNVLKAIRDIFGFLKNSLRVLPLLVFVLTIYKTFGPLLSNVFVAPAAQVFGFSTRNPYRVQAISVQDIMLTLTAMLFVVIINWIFNPKPKSD
jgi:hypothetical protein